MTLAVGDSSPADDGTGEGSLHFGWDRASGGVANDVVFLNATEWLANPEPDETAYQITVEAIDDCGGHETATLSATTPAAPTSPDLSGWKLVNDNPQFELTFPEGTVITAGGYLVVGRDNDQAGFEAEWGPLDPEVAYLDSGNKLIVNSTPRPYTLLDQRGDPVDGPTVTISKNTSKARTNACLDAGIDPAWTVRHDTEADPGRGAPPPCGAGVVITEMSDADDYRNELVELYFDAGASPP